MSHILTFEKLVSLLNEDTEHLLGDGEHLLHSGVSGKHRRVSRYELTSDKKPPKAIVCSGLPEASPWSRGKTCERSLNTVQGTATHPLLPISATSEVNWREEPAGVCSLLVSATTK